MKEEAPICPRCNIKMGYRARIAGEQGRVIVPADWQCPKCGKLKAAME